MARIDGTQLVMDEICIVDIFTKLIFDSQCALGISEEVVVSVLSDLVPSLTNASRRDLSEYLRAMSVDEMIWAVDQIKHVMDEQHALIAVKPVYKRHHLPR